MIENYLALIVLLLITRISKRCELPCIIIAFYVAYIVIDIMITYDNRWFYLINAVLDIVIMLMCFRLILSGVSYAKTTFAFMLYVAVFYVIPDLSMYSMLNMKQYHLVTDIYYSVMNVTVFIDILFALVGSDNIISKWLFKDN